MHGNLRGYKHGAAPLLRLGRKKREMWGGSSGNDKQQSAGEPPTTETEILSHPVARERYRALYRVAEKRRCSCLHRWTGSRYPSRCGRLPHPGSSTAFGIAGEASPPRLWRLGAYPLQ